jgi:RNA polymerase sigma factor (sigma-70 family)
MNAMATRSETDHDRNGPSLRSVIGERKQLTNLTYRLLSSLQEAEDVVQETYARWYTMSPEQQDAIESLGGWLTTVASRICLDVLGSARIRRERYVGEWIPEPLPGSASSSLGPRDPTTGDPADRVTLDESVNMAFLVVLESMTPAERVAFILHDVFRYPFADIATIVGRTPAACRQLASSGRRRMSDARSPGLTPSEHADIVRTFKHAWEAKDILALIDLLDPDATAVADGGGRATAELHPVRGAQQIARLCVDLAARAPEITLVERIVNGEPGLVGRHGARIVTVYAFAIGIDRITHIWAMRNPDKLAYWGTA